MTTNHLSLVERVRLEQYQKAKAKPEAERSFTERSVVNTYERAHPELTDAIDTVTTKTYPTQDAYVADVPRMIALGWQVVTAVDVAKEPSIAKRVAFGFLFVRTKHSFVVTYRRVTTPDPQP